MISDEEREKVNAKGTAYRSTDGGSVAAGGCRTASCGCGTGSRSERRHDLRLESKIWRHECKRSTGSETVARGECAAEKDAGRRDAGQRHAVVGDKKKRVGLVSRRQDVKNLMKDYQVS